MINLARWPAEWELQSSVLLVFPTKNSDWGAILDTVLPCFIEYAKVISRFQQVIIVGEEGAEIENYFSTEEKENIIFVACDSNDTWARDFGPITVFKSGEPILLDFKFNGWGNKFEASKDNQITTNLVRKNIWSKEYHKVVDFVLEGGSIETNGEGILLTTSKCLLSKTRNPSYSKESIEELLAKYLGVDHFLWLDHGEIEGDDTDAHIDTLARFVNQNTIAYVKCDDENDENYESLKKMEAELSEFKNKKGLPFKLIPLPWPDACFSKSGHRLPATYANFLMINDAVLVPLYQVKQDQEAIEVFKRIFPDRTIIGLNCRPIIEQNGSLHCLTMQIPLLKKPKNKQ